jgi:hypothetical protein
MLLEDPKAAVEQEPGTQLPEGVRVVAMEETAETIYLVLPKPAPYVPTSEGPTRGPPLPQIAVGPPRGRAPEQKGQDKFEAYGEARAKLLSENGSAEEP